VTQVSYNDALAYCKWRKTELPNYEEYWELAARDTEEIIFDADTLVASNKVNVVGNTWDITKDWNDKNEIRLAGGSYLCSKTSCDGTNPARRLFVSPDTGNSHISFSVVTKND